MASYRSLSAAPMAAFLLLTIFTLVSALDMSILSNNDNHLGVSMSGSRPDDEVMAMYEEWLVKHGKVYNALGEKEKRFQIFKDNLRYIDEHNAQDQPYKLGLNRFADLTNDEYRSTYLGTKIGRKKKVSQRYAPRVGEKLPESVDWRKKGAVTEIKDQGSCGC